MNTQTQPTATPALVKAPENRQNFCTIRASLQALESLEQAMDDLRSSFALTMGVHGWKPQDNLGDFLDCEDSERKEFFRKLVNLGLDLP